MLSHHKAVRSAILIVLCIVCCAYSVFADDSKTPTSVNLTTMSTQHSRDLASGVVRCLKKQIDVSEFLVLSEQPRFRFVVTTQVIPQRDEIVISLVTTMPVPKEVVKLVSENEGFYKTSGFGKELPADGKFIREYVSSEWMQEFGQIINSEIFIFPADRVENECKTILEDFVTRYKLDRN